VSRSKRMLLRVSLNLAIVAILFASLVGPFAGVMAEDADTTWSFGVMGDTQWSCPTDPAGENPGGCSVSVINQLNDEFIAKGVKFVVQTGDLTNVVGANMSIRAAAAQELYDAGIGFFPMRGNHDIYDGTYGIPAIRSNFPQTQGLSNTFGATNFTSPDIADLTGVSYAFNYNNCTFVIVDDWATISKQIVVVPNYPYGYSVGEQQDWISGRLDESTRGTDQAFVFAHHNLIGENHFDCLFTGYANSNLDMQNTFFNSLQSNDVKYFFSGHEHLYNRSLVTSPDGASVVEDIICSHDDPKFINPKDPNSANFFGQKVRQEQISQELNNLGYYICTVSGTRITVDYYSDVTGGYLGDASWPKGPVGAGTQITPTFNFVLKESWGYDLNGKQFKIQQGQDYTSVADSYGGTDLQILSGINDCTDKDFFNRAYIKTVNTGWMSSDDDSLISNVATLWGMNDFAEAETDVYTIALTYDPAEAAILSTGSVGIASLNDEGEWVNTIDLNYGGTQTFVYGPWLPGYELGTYGIDPATNTAWAVINHASDFAVANDIEPATSAQVWQLDSETTTPGYEMEKTGGPGDDGQTGSVVIGSFGSHLWIADQAAMADVTFAADGAWKVELSTDSPWIDDEASGCSVQIGQWDGTMFTSFSSVFDVFSVTWDTSTGKYVFELKGQSGEETVDMGNYLAVQICNTDSIMHTVYTGEGTYSSCITSPQNDPGYPLPELAAGILAGLGLAGLAVYIIIKRKRTSTGAEI
jgi:hypothetical protein